MTDFGHALRTARIAKGINQTQFADRIGKTPAYISSLESGRISPPRDPLKIGDMAEALGADVEALCRAACLPPPYVEG